MAIMIKPANGKGEARLVKEVNLKITDPRNIFVFAVVQTKQVL